MHPVETSRKKVLQIALKHATAIRGKIKDSSQKRVSDCDQDTSRHNAESSTEENTSNMMDTTTSAVDQLCVKWQLKSLSDNGNVFREISSSIFHP